MLDSEVLDFWHSHDDYHNFELNLIWCDPIKEHVIKCICWTRLFHHTSIRWLTWVCTWNISKLKPTIKNVHLFFCQNIFVQYLLISGILYRSTLNWFHFCSGWQKYAGKFPYYTSWHDFSPCYTNFDSMINAGLAIHVTFIISI